MSRMTRRTMLGAGLVAVPGLMSPFALGQDKKEAVAPGQPVLITVTTASPAPDVSLLLGKREGHVTPVRAGCQHTGGGNIDVQQPSPDTFVVTMSGVAVAHGSPCGPATAALEFTLNQAFEVSFDNPKVKAAKLTMEGQVVGFLRSHKNGTAEESATATVTSSAGGPSPLGITMPSHAVGAGENLSVNDKEGPVTCVVAAGKFCVNASFRVSASMPKTAFPGKAPSAEFAPDPALDPLWISYKEPFKGAKKGELGFQITLKVTPEELPEGNGDKNGDKNGNGNGNGDKK